MILVHANLEEITRVIRLARDMASYIHHCAAWRDDSEHTEPKDKCNHPDCKTVREIKVQ